MRKKTTIMVDGAVRNVQQYIFLLLLLFKLTTFIYIFTIAFFLQLAAKFIAGTDDILPTLSNLSCMFYSISHQLFLRDESWRSGFNVLAANGAVIFDVVGTIFADANVPAW